MIARLAKARAAASARFRARLARVSRRRLRPGPLIIREEVRSGRNSQDDRSWLRYLSALPEDARAVLEPLLALARTPAASVMGRPVGTTACAHDCCVGAAAWVACGGGGGAAWTGVAAGTWLTGGAAARGVYWNCIVMPGAIPGGTATCIICPSGAWTCIS